MSLSPSSCEKAAKLMTVLMAHWNAYRQAPLPGPREKMEIDWSLGDAELFESYFFPAGSISTGCTAFLGDLWVDVTWPKKV